MQIEFTSSKFVPVLPEDCQVNDGVYGFELAWWLARKLAARGIVTSYPIGEDWGWLIEHVDEERELETTIGCSCLVEDKGIIGSSITWSVFLRPHVSLIDRIRGISHQAHVEQLGEHIIDCLRAEGVECSQA